MFSVRVTDTGPHSRYIPLQALTQHLQSGTQMQASDPCGEADSVALRQTVQRLQQRLAEASKTGSGSAQQRKVPVPSSPWQAPGQHSPPQKAVVEATPAPRTSKGIAFSVDSLQTFFSIAAEQRQRHQNV